METELFGEPHHRYLCDFIILHQYNLSGDLSVGESTVLRRKRTRVTPYK